MQEYKRQIAYLYAYERGEQLRSTGFVKAEERGGQDVYKRQVRGGVFLEQFSGWIFLQDGGAVRQYSF